MKTYIIEVVCKLNSFTNRVWTETIRANSESEAISQVVYKIKHTHGNGFDQITDIDTKVVRIL